MNIGKRQETVEDRQSTIKPRRGDMLIDRENYLISNKPRRGDMLIDV